MASAFAPGHDVDDVFVEDLQRTSRAAFRRQRRDRRLPAAAPLPQQDRRSDPAGDSSSSGSADGRRVDPASLDGYGPVANATVVTIPEAGHTPIWEAPERTAELIGVGAGAR